MQTLACDSTPPLSLSRAPKKTGQKEKVKTKCLIYVVRLNGFVGSDAELKTTKAQREYAVLSLATTANNARYAKADRISYAGNEVAGHLVDKGLGMRSLQVRQNHDGQVVIRIE